MAGRRSRLDERIVAEGLAESRSQAQRLIMAGLAQVNGQRADKASHSVTDDDVVSVTAPPRFVSRGGDKLANALDDVGWQVDGELCLDVGASTGGFTDCLLQGGAAHVVALDVGYGQLHPRIRDDPRVTVMERVNARSLTVAALPFAPTLITCDASFISLATVIAAPVACAAPGFRALLLCKPQFEAGPARVGKGGIVRDAAVRDEVLRTVTAQIEALGLAVQHTVEARPRGSGGNIEYVLAGTDARQR